MLRLLIIPVTLLALDWTYDDEVWKTKRASEWTEAQTKQVLTASPWAAMVVPQIKKEKTPGKPGAGLGVGGLGAAIPGLGRRRNAQQTQEPDSSTTTQGEGTPEPYNIRWESALPIREAELKARETNAPAVDEDHYAVAVYGIPRDVAKDLHNLGDRLKGQAEIRREGQKEIKPWRVDVIDRDDGLLIIYLFPKTKEITSKDRAEFHAEIGRYDLTQLFHVDEMIYQGKTEL
jgi:hypothetical protein